MKNNRTMNNKKVKKIKKIKNLLQINLNPSRMINNSKIKINNKWQKIQREKEMN